MYYIGVDLGTSAVKLLLMEADGSIRNVVSKEYPLYFPHPGWSEQKPEDWWNAVVEGIRELVPEAKPSLMDRLKADKPEHEARQMIPPVPERER